MFTPATAASATADSDGVFGVILRDVERMYCEVDAVFEANGLAHTELPLASALVHSSAERGTTVLEVFANKLLPFDMHATADAVWHHFAFGRDRTPFRDYQFESSEVEEWASGLLFPFVYLPTNVASSSSCTRCQTQSWRASTSNWTRKGRARSSV